MAFSPTKHHLEEAKLKLKPVPITDPEKPKENTYRGRRHYPRLSLLPKSPEVYIPADLDNTCNIAPIMPTLEKINHPEYKKPPKLEKKQDNMNTSSCPVRSYMTDTSLKWRYGQPPNFETVDKLYMEGRTKMHRAGSLEKMVEDLIRTYDMEITHKVDPKEWSLLTDDFQLMVNGCYSFSSKQILQIGPYNCLLKNCPVYDGTHESFESLHEQMKKCFPRGFAWELLELYSGPPRMSFKWRHWAYFEGAYKSTQPTGEMLELFGCGTATVTADNKLQKLEIFFDPSQLFSKLSGTIQHIRKYIVNINLI